MSGVTDELENFMAIDIGWSGILVGNGASLTMSGCFAYHSLFDQAKTVEPPLTATDISIFDQLQTKNFEQVLSALNQARSINGVLGLEHQTIIDSYARIQTALIQSVHGVHLSWDSIPAENLLSVRQALLAYDYVYSTNYDLLLYWAVNKDSNGFKDFFWGGHFDLGNTEIWDKVTKLLFLHGGLHLYKTLHGTYKRKAEGYNNLLDLFGTPIPDEQDAVPLFVTEGTSADKLKSIYSNDYLSFAYNRFANHHGPLVILGQSLDSTFDKHLIDALRSGPNRTLGIGIHRGLRTPTEIIQAKTNFYIKLSGFEFRFFDSASHPLGDPALHLA